MRDRRPVYLLLASSLTFISSLYLPWLEVRVPPGPDVAGLLNLAENGKVEGWASEVGVAASLAALVLVAAGAFALARPRVIEDKLALAPVAFAVCYLAIATLVALHAAEKLTVSTQHTGTSNHFRFAYGAYLGVAAAAVALIAALLYERTRIARPARGETLVLVPAAGLLVSFLLPWLTPAFGSSGASLPGINSPVTVLAAGSLCIFADAAFRSGRALFAAAGIAVLTGGGVGAIVSNSALRVDYGAWLALGFALALVAAVVVVLHQRPTIPSLSSALPAAAAGLFLVALFLPWQQFCTPSPITFRKGLGPCIVTSGWATGEPGAVAGGLALVLVFVVVVGAWRATSAAEIALAIAILTATAGISIVGEPFSPYSLDYGAYVGFAAAGILVVTTLSRIRPPRLELGQVVDRLVPIAAAVACFCAVALPLWSVLPDRWSSQAYVLHGWYAMAGLLLSVHLVRRWLEFAGGRSSGVGQLLLIPLALLTLTALELIVERGDGMTWGGGILVGLCLLLTLFGRVEQTGRLQRVPVPEILRVDRLPESEG